MRAGMGIGMGVEMWSAERRDSASRLAVRVRRRLNEGRKKETEERKEEKRT